MWSPQVLDNTVFIHFTLEMYTCVLHSTLYMVPNVTKSQALYKFELNSINTVHFTVHSTLYTTHCTLYIVYNTLYTTHCTLHTVNSVHFYLTLHTVNTVHFTLHSTLYTLSSAPSQPSPLAAASTGDFCSCSSMLLFLLFAELLSVCFGAPVPSMLQCVCSYFSCSHPPVSTCLLYCSVPLLPTSFPYYTRVSFLFLFLFCSCFFCVTVSSVLLWSVVVFLLWMSSSISSVLVSLVLLGSCFYCAHLLLFLLYVSS